MKLVRFALAITLMLFVMIPATLADDNIIPDVVYGHKHGMAMTFDVLKPQEDENGAGILFMVSGGWRSQWFPPQRAVMLLNPMLSKGFTVFVVRHGSSPKYKIPEIVGDVRRAVRSVRLNAEKWGVDPQRLGVFGGSAGGHLSLMLGTTSDEGDKDSKDPIERVTNRVAAVVAYFPPTDLRGMVNEPPNQSDRFPALNFSPDRDKEFSPILHVSSDDPPTLFVHGDEDDLVPLDHSTKMLDALKEKNVACELVVLEGAGHGFRGKDQQKASAALVDWFTKHLVDNAPVAASE